MLKIYSHLISITQQGNANDTQAVPQTTLFLSSAMETHHFLPLSQAGVASLSPGARPAAAAERQLNTSTISLFPPKKLHSPCGTQPFKNVVACFGVCF